MTLQMTAPARFSTVSILRSAGALVAGFLTVGVLSGVADAIAHSAGLFPTDGTFTYAPLPYAIAIAYRAVFGIAAGYVTARLAPRRPIVHALLLGIVGLLLSLAGAVAMWGMGPNWYPIIVALICVPTALVGARIAHRS
jgi:hypothetical protein